MQNQLNCRFWLSSIFFISAFSLFLSGCTRWSFSDSNNDSGVGTDTSESAVEKYPGQRTALALISDLPAAQQQEVISLVNQASAYIAATKPREDRLATPEELSAYRSALEVNAQAMQAVIEQQTGVKLGSTSQNKPSASARRSPLRVPAITDSSSAKAVIVSTNYCPAGNPQGSVLYDAPITIPKGTNGTVTFYSHILVSHCSQNAGSYYVSYQVETTINPITYNCGGTKGYVSASGRVTDHRFYDAAGNITKSWKEEKNVGSVVCSRPSFIGYPINYKSTIPFDGRGGGPSGGGGGNTGGTSGSTSGQTTSGGSSAGGSSAGGSSSGGTSSGGTSSGGTTGGSTTGSGGYSYPH